MIRKTWRHLRPYVRGKTATLLGMTATGLLSGVFEAVALLLAVRVALDVGTGDEHISLAYFSLSAPVALGAAAAAGAAAFLGHLIMARLAAAVGSSALTATRSATLKRYTEAPWSVQSLQREGALQETLTMLCYRVSDLGQWLAYGLGQLAALVMFLVAALAVDWRFTLMIIGAGAIVVFLLRPISRNTQVRSRAFVEANSHFAEESSRLASASMELKVFGVEERAARQLGALNREVGRRQNALRFSSLLAVGVFKDVALFLLIGSVAALYMIGGNALADAGVVVALVVRGLSSAQQTSSSYQNVSEIAPSLFALDERLSAMEVEPEADGVEQVHDFQSLELIDVDYSYSTREKLALNKVSARIIAGDFVGVVGPSGGGKSTLLQLILRLREPTSGTILLNGEDYLTYSLRSWHEFVGFVPQEPNLIEATIAENISYYRPFDLGEIRNASKLANIDEEIRRMPDGYETQLGPRGSGLSGGQKQRIAIARALVGRPRLIVMDEPTSALDPDSEGAVVETISQLKGSVTMIIVAHRPSTVADCDYLLEARDGLLAQIPNSGSDGDAAIGERSIVKPL